MPSTLTVSVCAQSSSVRPPPVPGARTRTLGRPGVSSRRSTRRPASRPQRSMSSAIRVSPAPPGTSEGFTESVATSSESSAVRSELMGLINNGRLVAVVAHHLALALAVLATAAAALRVASVAVERGLIRIAAAAALAATAMIVETLAFGLVGLGSDPVLLTSLAIAAWLAARGLLPRPAVGVVEELAQWWASLLGLERAGAGAVAGAWVPWVIWLVGYPLLG